MLAKQCLEGIGSDPFAFGGVLEVMAVTCFSAVTVHFFGLGPLSLQSSSLLCLLGAYLLQKQTSQTDPSSLANVGTGLTTWQSHANSSRLFAIIASAANPGNFSHTVITTWILTSPGSKPSPL
jgi:hypothetical protein